MRMVLGAAVVLLVGGAAWGWPICLQTGTVKNEAKISATAGGFKGVLDNNDWFASSIAILGDLDGDGIPDLAVGAFGDDDGGTNRGAIWILFMNPDGTVKGEQKISDIAGGFEGVLDNDDLFGGSVAPLGDLDGDGVPDLAVGAYRDDDGGTDRGAVWILFLNADGTVKGEQKISGTAGGFQGVLNNVDWFGFSIASLGDLDGDGVPDLAVGAIFDDDGGPHPGAERGTVWILFLNADGTVKGEQKISASAGGLQGMLDDGDRFGSSVASLGDLDGDGLPELAVGAISDDDGGPNRGAIWILFLNADGTVKGEQKISSTAGGFEGVLDNIDEFGRSVACLGDLNHDGVPDLAVGTIFDDDGGFNRGAVWILFMNTDGTVKGQQKISSTAGGLQGVLNNSDWFGFSIASPGDFDSDGVPDVLVGAIYDDDGGTDRGAVWILSLDDGLTISGCEADANGDGVVDADDLGLLLSGFGQVVAAGCRPDTNGDGIIDADDLSALLNAFGNDCP